MNNCENGTYDCDGCKNNGDCLRQGTDGHPYWAECIHICSGCLYGSLCDESFFSIGEHTNGPH